jgi:hypothetical protein
MKKMVFIVLISLFIGCNSQEKNKQETQEPEKKELATIEPKEKWDVKKEYDEFGNLIKYDSIYSYSYSNIEGDSIKVNLDSIMNSFRGYFKENSPFNWNERFSYFPQNDSLFMNDFFQDDYFFNQWNRQPLDISRMMRQMDSTRNSFLKKFYPGLIESKKEN